MAVKVIEQGILLTFDEIRILLYSMGASEIEGIYMPEKEFSEREILSAMHHMSEVGFIEAGQERFRIREDVRNILNIMAAPLMTDIWRPSGEEGPAFFLYFRGDEVLVSEQYFRRRDTLRLTLFGVREFERWREEIIDDHCGDRGSDHGKEI